MTMVVNNHSELMAATAAPIDGLDDDLAGDNRPMPVPDAVNLAVTELLDDQAIREWADEAAAHLQGIAHPSGTFCPGCGLMDG